MRALLLALTAAFFAVSCSKSTGGLGNGAFSFTCVSDCSGGEGSIVPGSRFKMSYAPSDSSSFPNATVTPVAPDFIAVESDGTFVALHPGTPYVYAMSKGLVLDIQKLTVLDSATPATDAGK